MTPEVRELLNSSTMDKAEVNRLHKLYVDGDEGVFLDLFMEARKAARTIVRQRWTDQSIHDLLDVLADADAYLWEKLGRIQVDEGGLPHYLYAALTAKMKGALQKARSSIAHKVPEDYIPVNGQLPTHRAVDARLFLEDMPAMALKRISQKIRFGSPTREACLYAARKLLTGQRVVALVIKKQYKVKDTQFVIDYCTVLCRNEMYDIREHLAPLVDTSAMDFVFDPYER